MGTHNAQYAIEMHGMNHPQQQPYPTHPYFVCTKEKINIYEKNFHKISSETSLKMFTRGSFAEVDMKLWLSAA